MASVAVAEKLTIATVNNGDMIRMQKLTDDFTAKNPGIELEWVTLEENVLRQRVTTDIATKGGQYDIMTIGTYEVPIWGKQGWLVSLNDLPASYDIDDLLPAIRGGLTVDGNLYAAPFYGESSMVMYRKDLMAKEGWANVPPGIRTSLYTHPEYAKVPFAQMTLDSINAAEPQNPTVDNVPYVGVQFVAIPEFQGIATSVGQQFSVALAGTVTVDQALDNAQKLTSREMTKAGYIK